MPIWECVKEHNRALSTAELQASRALVGKRLPIFLGLTKRETIAGMRCRILPGVLVMLMVAAPHLFFETAVIAKDLEHAWEFSRRLPHRDDSWHGARSPRFCGPDLNPRGQGGEACV